MSNAINSGQTDVMIKGSIPALVTPMTPDGGLDKPALEQLIQWHLEEGSHALVAVGTTGESATLSVDEHCTVIEWVVGCVAGQVPVIAGTGANCTREAIELTSRAKKAGANAALLVTPYYNKPPQEGLYQHYKTIAEAVDIPQILYNVPGRTACDLSVETTIRLSQLDNIIGIKDATAELSRLPEMKASCADDFIYLSGDDATACDYLLAGGDGVISVTSNVAPAKMKALCEFAVQDNGVEAAAVDETLSGLHNDLFIEPSPIPVKWVLNKMGKIQKGIRLPLVWLSEASEPALRQAMQQAGIEGAL